MKACIRPTAVPCRPLQVLDYFAGGGLPPLVGAGLFCGAVGGLLYKEGTRTIDSLNQVPWGGGGKGGPAGAERCCCQGAALRGGAAVAGGREAAPLQQRPHPL